MKHTTQVSINTTIIPFKDSIDHSVITSIPIEKMTIGYNDETLQHSPKQCLSTPKWMASSEGTLQPYQVFPILADVFNQSPRNSQSKSLNRLLSGTQSQSSELNDEILEVSCNFQAIIQLQILFNLTKITQKVSCLIKSYNETNQYIEIPFTQNMLTFIQSQESINLIFSLSFKFHGVISHVLTISIDLNNHTSNQKFIEHVTPSLTQNDIQIILEIEPIGINTIELRLLSCTLPKNIFEEFLERKLRLLSLGEELAQVTSIMDIQGIIYELSCSNLGSRTCQKLLDKASPIEIDQVLQGLTPQLVDMVMDSYNNYVFQNLLQNCSQELRLFSISKIFNSLPTILQTKTGTHSMQALLQSMKCMEELQLYLKGIQGYQISLSCNQQATHFIQKLLYYLPTQTLQQTIFYNLQYLALNQFGVVVAKTMMAVTAMTSWRYAILQKLYTALPELISNEFGHYLIQETFEIYGEADCHYLKQRIMNDLVRFSCNAYSSSVIERMLSHYCQNFGSEVLSWLMIQPTLLIKLLDDKSGSFVVHRILDSLKGADKTFLDNLIVSTIPHICGYYSRNKWSKFYSRALQ